jgi:hypothetical protein
MKITGSKQRLFCGAWLLATVLLGGLNAFALMSLEARPTVGYSNTIRELQANLPRFDAILGGRGLPLHIDWKLSEFLNPSPVVDNASAIRPPTQVQTESCNRASEPTPLPALSGVIRTLDPNGSVYFQAVLNGRSYREKDRLDDYSVDQITHSGVVLRRSEQSWFIQCPAPFYSSDQGE